MAFERDEETGKITDKERNAFIRTAGGTREGYKHWEIDWGDEVVGFTAKDKTQYGGETRNIPMGVEWLVVSMKIPESLKDRRAEVMGVIKDALEARWRYSGFDGEAVVKFTPKLIR